MSGFGLNLEQQLNLPTLFSMNLILSLQQQKTIKALQFYFDEIGR